jgi:trehalose/maltose transport system permease protein
MSTGVNYWGIFMAYSATDVKTDTQPQVYLISALLIFFGALALLAFLSGVYAVIGLREEAETFGTTLLRYLDAQGIILPLLELAAGVTLVRLGIRLLSRDVGAANWARQVMLWGIILGVVLAMQSGAAALSTPNRSPDAFLLPAVFVVLTMAVAYGYQWLGLKIDTFEGQETLTQTSSRFAWNLLVPTILVLIFVALRPLEETFIASLTDRRFAAGANAQVNFVGFDNYAELLGVRLDSIPCTTGDDGQCALDASGNRQYPRARDVLDEAYSDLRYREVSTWLTLGNSKIVLSARDNNFIGAVGNTLTFTAISVTLELILGLFIAMVINSKFTGRGLMRAAMLVPWAIPTVVSARLWTVMFDDTTSGVFNAVITGAQRFLGMPEQTVAWLARADLQVPAMIAIDVWKTTPFMALILLAGLQTIPEDMYEAADVDGANKLTQFLRLTLPLLRPTIAVALVFRTLDAIRVFDVFQVVLAQKQYSMATYNYYTLVNSQQLGYASAIGVVMFVIILLFTLAYVRILGVSAE